jgi:hypothetical protein
MGRYLVLVGDDEGETVTLDESTINVIAQIQAGLVEPADKKARDHYDDWFWAGNPPKKAKKGAD